MGLQTGFEDQLILQAIFLQWLLTVKGW